MDLVYTEHRLSITFEELGRASRSQLDWLQALVEEGALAPLGPAEAAGLPREHWRFDDRALQRARTARRLARDLQLDIPALALVLQLLDEIERLRSRGA